MELEDFGLTIDESKKLVRKLSDMKNFYSDQETVNQKLKEDPIIYEVYEGKQIGNLMYALTVLNPGDIGGEYYMTKGHFHKKSVGEVYVGLEGEGILLLQDKQGNTKQLPIEPGKFSYVPKDYAHRSINTGNSKLKFLAIYSTDAGHDYGSIEKEGFKEKITKN